MEPSLSGEVTALVPGLFKIIGASRSDANVLSRRQESPSEGEEEPAAAGAKPFRLVRRAVEPAGEPLAGARNARRPRETAERRCGEPCRTRTEQGRGWIA